MEEEKHAVHSGHSGVAGGNLYAARLPGETHGTSNRNHHGFSRGGGGVTPEVTPAQPRVAGGRDVTVEIAAENMAFNEVYLTDATTYSTSGKVFVFDLNGSFKYSFATSNIPSVSLRVE